MNLKHACKANSLLTHLLLYSKERLGMFQEKTLHCGTQILGSLETYTENTAWRGELKGKGKVDTNLAYLWYFLHLEEDKLLQMS